VIHKNVHGSCWIDNYYRSNNCRERFYESLY